MLFLKGGSRIGIKLYYYYSFLFIVLGFATFITFAVVFRLLNTKVHFQFVQMKKQIVQIFISTFLILLLVIIIYVAYVSSDKVWDWASISELNDYCET
jgi:amino acid permease